MGVEYKLISLRVQLQSMSMGQGRAVGRKPANRVGARAVRKVRRKGDVLWIYLENK